MNITENTIRPRLFWFAERVRQGILFVDIGTDHAKLPVYLVQSGKIQHAIASDIGEGPIGRARTYIQACGLQNSIATYIGDGVGHLPITPPADIAICGMGGETIRNILSDAPFLKHPEIRLLLQPMTDFALLRHYLSQNGFTPVEEDIVSSEGRMYQCMIVRYTNEPHTLSAVEAELGALAISKRSDTFLQYVQRRKIIVQKCLSGKNISGADITQETNLLNAYNMILKG